MVREPWSSICDLYAEFADYTLSLQRFLFPYFTLHEHVHAKNVARYVQSLLNRYRSTNPAVYTVLYATSHLHDVGMSLPPDIINELQLCEDDIKKDAPDFFREFKAEMGSCYGYYFRNGSLVLSAKTSGISSPFDLIDSYVVRKLHPWISSLYASKWLPKAFPEFASEGVPRQTLAIVVDLIRYHSNRTDPENRVYFCGGYELNLRELALLFRLADALDFSRKRGVFIFDHIVRNMVKVYPIALKHWIFKLSVKEVSLGYDNIELEVDLREDWLEDRAILLGVLLFEVNKNLFPDLKSFIENCYKLDFFINVKNKKIDLLSIQDLLSQAYKCLKKLKPIVFDEIGKRIYDEVKENILKSLTDDYKKMVCYNIFKVIIEDFDIFDMIAFALRSGDRNTLQAILNRAINYCPIINSLLRAMSLS